MVGSNIYETSRLLDEYLLFHYGSEQQVFADGEIPYPAVMREALGFTRRTVGYFGDFMVPRGLDLGCAVGGSTFAMAEHCESVIGIDYSHAFIQAAHTLQQGDAIRYQRHDEGDMRQELIANVEGKRLRCRFEQGDAMALRADLGTFDRVHAANLICRLPRPMALLERLPSLVRPDGELILATPCTWLEEFTPPSAWPQADTFSWLHQQLAPFFELIHRCHEPFLIRETARKFQWSQSLVTCWRRR
ncbi:MAG: methyltransferase domain-containing protein [Akkermansiaceae bacterium]